MWYLIIPPIVVVSALGLLVWYLSRKSSDQALLEKLEEVHGTPKKPAFLRTKNFFLKLLEKGAQRFRLMTLRLHNRFGGVTQSLRKKREAVTEIAALHQAGREEAPQESSVPKRSFFGRFRRRSPLTEATSATGEAAPVSSDETHSVRESLQDGRENRGDILEAPLVRRSRRLGGDSTPASPHEPETRALGDEEPAPRPMVSEQVTEPEIRRKRTRQNQSQEEELIASIAENPKDHVAFEALGDYYMSIQNIKDAKECYRQVLKLRPVHRMVKIKIRRLEKILAEKV